jgi:hypothetical protein
MAYAFLMLAVLLTGKPVLAQQTTGDILGTVTDPSGAVVSHATVVVENVGTHEDRKVATTDSGDYVANLLNPGNYSISVSADGFQKYVVSSVTLAAGDRLRINVPMILGATSQTITVETQPSALQTDSSVLQTTIEPKTTQDLPLNGRNFIQLAQLVAGANEGPPDSLTNGSKLDDRRQSASVSVNGQSDVLNNQMIDGADNNERLIGTVAVRPSIDAIGEMSIQSNSYTAEVGRTGGAIVNVITKSGTNQFHGDVFEFFRNDLFDTSTYNFGATLPKNELRQNQFGGSLGGPILKDKAFFFGSYEAYRQVQGTAPQVLTVPDTTAIDPNNSNYLYGIQSADPVALDYFKMFPAPNTTAVDKNTGLVDQYIHGFNNVQNSSTYDGRVDYSINPSNSIYGRFILNSVTTSTPGPFPNVTVNSVTFNPNSLFYGLGNAQDTDFDALLNYIHTFNGNLLLELKGAYTRSNNQSTPEADGKNPNRAMGQPNVNTPLSDSTGLAPIYVVMGSALGGVYFQPLKDQDNTFQYLGTVTYTHNKHNIKMGSTVIRRQLTSYQSSDPEGLWIFLNYPLLLQGTFMSNGGRSVELDAPHLRVWEPSVFVQDDWRASKGLTLNIGLRYDLFTPYTEIRDRISTWDPASASLLIAGQNGVSNTAGIQTDYHGVAPRFGFAYSAPHDLVIRGGYGIGYFPMNTTSGANLKNDPFVANTQACGSPLMVLYGLAQTGCDPNYSSFAQGFAASTLNPGHITDPGASIPDAVSPHFRTSYMQQFNLTLQKDFAGNVLTASYVGLLGRQLGQLLGDLNAPAPGVYASSAAFQAARPNYTKFNNLGSIGYFQTGGKSSFNTLQLSFERRMKNNLTVNANYAWAHNLDNSTGLSEEGAGGYGAVPSRVSKMEYGNSTLDNRSRIAGSANYQFPFGKNLRGTRSLLMKGWQANLIDVWGTGSPFTVVNSSSVSGTGITDRPNQAGNWKRSNPGISEFFNTAAFVAQSAGTLGSERRDQLFGPHFRHTDLSFFKDITIREGTAVEFRAESFNLTNTANFGAPNASLGGSNFGAITGMTTNYTPRVLQFALKLNY